MLKYPVDFKRTLNCPWESVIAPFSAFLWPSGIKLTVAYSNGVPEMESSTCPDISPSGFDGDWAASCDWMSTIDKKKIQIDFMVQFRRLQMYCRFRRKPEVKEKFLLLKGLKRCIAGLAQIPGKYFYSAGISICIF
jgi:hypothetical protein